MQRMEMDSWPAGDYRAVADDESTRPQTTTGVNHMGKGMDRKKETKKKPAKSKEEKRAEKKAKKG